MSEHSSDLAVTPVPSQFEICPGCSARVPTTNLPGHRYIGASPRCWAVYGTVLAREYGEWRLPAVHRLTVDAYAAQHPGTPSPQSTRSVAVHLIGLFVVLELGLSLARAAQAIRRAAEKGDRFVWLTPPPQRGNVTILEVADATALAEHEQAVQRWARSVWRAWEAHHATIRQWAQT